LSEDLGLLKYRLAAKYRTPYLVHLDLKDDRVAKEAAITLKECLKIRNARGAVAALNIALKDICKLDTATISRSTERFEAAGLLNKHHMDADRVLQYAKESFIHTRGGASAWILQLWSPRFIDEVNYTAKDKGGTKVKLVQALKEARAGEEAINGLAELFKAMSKKDEVQLPQGEW
jgi:hypothetical protein